MNIAVEDNKEQITCHPHNVRPQVSDLPDLVEPEALGLNANAAVVRSSLFKMMIVTTTLVMLTKLTTNQMSRMTFSPMF